jgi:hypothetical protein
VVKTDGKASRNKDGGRLIKMPLQLLPLLFRGTLCCCGIGRPNNMLTS